jgi:Copper amine oxidase N-terminal domain
VKRYAPLIVLLAGLTASAPANPHVVVNGKSLPPDTVAIIDKRVYVAVRAVGEALGAYVTTNDAQRTVTVTTLLRQVVLRVDSPNAMVNGQEIRLSAPPRRSGTRIMLPLRALAAVYGASVTYKSKTHGVVVSSGSHAVGPPPSAQPSLFTKTYSGTVVAVNMEGREPTIQFTAASSSYTASVPAGTAVEFRDVHGAMTGHGTLSAVRPGDALIVTLDAAGRLVSIADLFASVSGTIASVADESMVLTNGRVISASPNAIVALDGKPASFASLQAGDQVTVREDPISGEVRDVVALTPGGYAAAATATPSAQTQGASALTITSANDNAQRPLRAGSVLTVTLDGTPGAQAEFDLSDVFAHNPMRETQPGHYEGTYEVSVGTNLTNAPILVRLTKNGLTALAEAPDPATIITTPPSVGEIEPGNGSHINISRPNIIATFVTVGNTGMDPGSLKLEVNGRDVTAESTRTPSFISYYPTLDLPPGLVDVRLQGTDIAGNGLEYDWSFTVAGQ